MRWQLVPSGSTGLPSAAGWDGGAHTGTICVSSRSRQELRGQCWGDGKSVVLRPCVSPPRCPRASVAAGAGPHGVSASGSKTHPFFFSCLST